MNSLFVNLQKIINSILSKYLRFIVMKNICQYINLWLNFHIHRSFDECLKPIFVLENWIFLEDKVLIGGGIDDGFAGLVTHATRGVDDDGGGLVVGGEGVHLLDPPLLWWRGDGWGGGVWRGGRRSQRANHIFSVLTVKQLQRIFLHFGIWTRIFSHSMYHLERKVTTFNSVAIMFSMVWME